MPFLLYYIVDLFRASDRRKSTKVITSICFDMANSLDSKFIAYLNAKNIPFTKDSDGDICFCHEGQQLCYICNNNDYIPYFRLIQFDIDRVKKNERLCLKACNGINRCMKIVKAYISYNNMVNFTVETFIPLGVHHIEELFDRLIGVFPNAKSEYKKIKAKCKKEAKEGHSSDDEDLMGDELDELFAQEGDSLEDPNPEGIDLQTYCQLVGKKPS